MLAGAVLLVTAALPPCVCAAELRLGPAALSVMGQDTLTFRTQQVSGSEASRGAYCWEDYSLTAGFEHRTDLVVHGELLPGLRLEAAVARGPYAPTRQRLTFTFDGSDAVVKAGDLSVLFDGTRLAAFQRSLRGIQVETKLPRGAFTLIASQSKPAVRSDLIYGRNSSGPYYLAASPVIDASEVVEIDGRRMQRGADYSIDYQVGLIQFAPTLIVAPTSRIAVSYEYDAPGGASGSLVGLRALYPVSSALRLGATYLTLERRAAASSSAAVREDRWQGNNTPGPFTLTCRPIVPGSERVRLDGILQVAGRDYRVDYATGTILFLTPVPAGVYIIVTYQVESAPTADTDRSLVGLDAHYTAGRHLNLDAEVARSVGGVGAASSSGGALALGARGEWERLSLSANIRSAAAAFTPFESAGSKAVRSGYDWTLAVRPALGLRLSASMRDHRRPYFEYGDAAQALVRDRSHELTLEFSRPGWPTLSYLGSWSALKGAGANSLTERSGNQIVTLGYEGEVYGIKATYRRNANARQGELPTASSYGYSATDAYSGSGRGAALSAWYRPTSKLNVVCDLASSAMSLAGGGKSSADSSRMAIEYAPTSQLAISLGYRANSSGATVSADGCSVGGYTSRSQTINLRHNPLPDLSLNLGYERQMSQGGYGTNSDTDAWTGGFLWQAAKSLSLLAQYTRQNLTYLGASGRSANDISSLGATIGPFGSGLKLDLSYSHMRGAASGSFGSSYGALGSTATGDAADTLYGYSSYGSLAAQGMANSSLRARITYPVANRHQAFAEWEASSNSGYPGGSRRSALAFGWQIALTQGVNFVVDWRRIDSESTDSSYSYRAQTLSGQLGMKF